MKKKSGLKWWEWPPAIAGLLLWMLVLAYGKLDDRLRRDGL